MKDIEILRAKGLMTARGIVEFFCQRSFSELKGKKILGEKERFVATSFLLKLPSLVEGNNISAEEKFTNSLFNSGKTCNVNLADLYGVVSKEIHGFPWNGDSVIVFYDQMTEHEACVIQFLANEMGLGVQKRTS